jgi:hypothetical protein
LKKHKSFKKKLKDLSWEEAKKNLAGYSKADDGGDESDD